MTQLEIKMLDVLRAINHLLSLPDADPALILDEHSPVMYTVREILREVDEKSIQKGWTP